MIQSLSERRAVVEESAQHIDDNEHDQAMAVLAQHAGFHEAVTAFELNETLIMRLGHAPPQIQEVRRQWTKLLAQHLEEKHHYVYKLCKEKCLL